MMREIPNLRIEQHRIAGPTNSNNGQAVLGQFGVQFSDGMGWEHVSVSVIGKNRCPSWEEMSWIKDQFWGDEEEVIQYHPRKSEFVNTHPYVLHLWRPIGIELPRPNYTMV